MELDEVFVFQDFQGLLTLTLVKRNTNEQFLITWLNNSKLLPTLIGSINLLSPVMPHIIKNVNPYTYGTVPGEM